MEPVSVSETPELFDQQTLKGGSHFSAIYWILSHSAHPNVDIILTEKGIQSNP